MLGFTEPHHASLANGFIPFDPIAAYEGKRVPVGVTTGVDKTLREDLETTFADELWNAVLHLVQARLH